MNGIENVFRYNSHNETVKETLDKRFTLIQEQNLFSNGASGDEMHIR